jgi:NAD(P)H-flavin reductase
MTGQRTAPPALTEPAEETAAVPRFYRVASRREDTADTVTLELAEPAHPFEPVPAFAPGQFAMLTAFGVGEVPISVSGLGDSGSGRARRLEHTLRAVGAVTRALHAAAPGSLIGVRGPFGTGWDVASAAGRDIVIVAGGIGLAPLRPVVLSALADRSRYGRIVLLAGARTPGDLLYGDELERWGRDGVEVAVTVDRAGRGWSGQVGLVTALIEPAGFAPGNSVAFVCGPDIMMRFTADALAARGIPASRIRVSLERNMRCGVGWCGHCQLGPLLVCRDGPVVSYDRAAALMRVREL